MADRNFFKGAFDKLATNDCIGDPNGEYAYGYLRVSSNGQAEEGASGLSRQIQNIHAIALEKGYRIPWEYVFADDHTGFSFEDRPELSKLRKEFKGRNRRANVIVVEYPDRLSRNTDWHQGYLLEEFKDHNIKPLFYKQFNSRIERSVMGAISQDGMEQNLARMSQGTKMKAQSGRVNAKVPAYGYMFADSFGNTLNTKKDTHYAINENEARE